MCNQEVRDQQERVVTLINIINGSEEGSSEYLSALNKLFDEAWYFYMCGVTKNLIWRYGAQDKRDVEDITAAVINKSFSSCIKSLHQFDHERCKFTTWCIGHAKNHLRNEMKKFFPGKKIGQCNDIEDIGSISGEDNISHIEHDEGPVNLLIQKEKIELIAKEIEELGVFNTQGRILYIWFKFLKKEGSLSYREIAENYNKLYSGEKPINTNQVYRVITNFREKLKENDGKFDGFESQS